MKFDVVVIGAGTCGLRFAIMSAKSGYRTALIEKSVVGGTCLNIGCIPTKALLYSAQLYDNVKNASGFGIKTTAKLDFKRLINHAQGIVSYGRKHAEKSVKATKNLRLFKGEARFTSKTSVKVGKQSITGKKFVIATGTKPSIPYIKGLGHTDFWTSTEALTYNKLPKTLGIVGGGYIAAEFASFFSTLGTKVTIFEILPEILHGVDQEAVAIVRKSLKKKGVHMLTNTEIINIECKGKKIRITAKSGRSTKNYDVEKALVATGRKPNSDLDLHKAGVDRDRKGYIKVNGYLQTSSKNIYAIGDVNGKAQFAHSAKRQAIALHNNLFRKKAKKEKIDLSIMPCAIFTMPIISSVGVNEVRKGVGVLKADFSHVGKAAIMEKTSGFVKVFFDKKTRRILGGTIVGPDADNIIHEIIALMNANAAIDTLLKTIHIHPTLSEVMANLR